MSLGSGMAARHGRGSGAAKQRSVPRSRDGLAAQRWHQGAGKERGRLDGTSGRVLSAGMVVNTCRVLVLEGEFLDVICSAIVLHGAVRINDELLQFKTRLEWY